MGDWAQLPFEQVLREPVRNGIYKTKQFHGRGSKIVNMGELFGHPRLRAAVPMNRVELTQSELQRFRLVEGDLIFARRSLTAEGAGKCSIVLELDGDTTFESSIIRARPDPAKALPLFLYYFFNSPVGFHQLDTIRRQVAVAGITGTDLSQLAIPVPVIDEQYAIASILGALDDKIDLTRRMNETIEAMVRALFKDWFINFGPVRAKVEGRPPYLAPEIWDLFADQLDNDDKPRGWKDGCLGDVARSVGESVRPNEMSPDTPYIGLEHMPRRSIALDTWEGAGKVNSGKLAFHRGDFLFGKLRPYFHKVGIAPLDGICSTDILVLGPKTPTAAAFVLSCISTDEFVAYTDQTSGGTKMPRTSWEAMARYPLCLPSEHVAEAFQRTVAPMLDRIILNIHEASSLAKTRDLLLPKLMSREIRLHDAKKLVRKVS